MNATLTGGISLLHVVEPSVRSVSNHLSSPWGPMSVFCRPGLPRSTAVAVSIALATNGVNRASPSLAGWPRRPAESSSSSYGPNVRVGLLSTPSREDAVIVHYKAQTLQPWQGLAPCRFNALTGARVRRFIAALRSPWTVLRRESPSARTKLEDESPHSKIGRLAGSQSTNQSGDESPHSKAIRLRPSSVSRWRLKPEVIDFTLEWAVGQWRVGHWSFVIGSWSGRSRAAERPKVCSHAESGNKENDQ